MPFRIFRVRTVAGANVAGLLLGAIVFANFFLLTLYVQQVLQWSALKTGVTFVATAGTAILWAGLAQALVTRIGVKPVMVAGFIALIAGHALVHADPGARLVRVRPAAGLPAGRLRAAVHVHPVSIAALAGVERHEAGLASGLINTAQQVGGAIGVAVTSSISISHFNHLVASGTPVPEAFTSGTQWAFWVTVGIAVAGLLASVTLIRPDEIGALDEAAVQA